MEQSRVNVAPTTFVEDLGAVVLDDQLTQPAPLTQPLKRGFIDIEGPDYDSPPRGEGDCRRPGCPMQVVRANAIRRAELDAAFEERRRRPLPASVFFGTDQK